MESDFCNNATLFIQWWRRRESNPDVRCWTRDSKFAEASGTIGQHWHSSNAIKDFPPVR